MTDQQNPFSAEARTNDIEQVNKALAERGRERGGNRATVEESVEYHHSRKIFLPDDPAKMTYAQGSQYLAELAQAEEEMYQFTEDFMCRPPDGALAFQTVLREWYGISAIGKAIRGWGGTQLPEFKTVHLSEDESIQVPWGLMEFPPLQAQFHMQARNARDYGPAFSVAVVAKKKFSESIQGLFDEVKAEIRKSSIYQHKAMRGLGTDIDSDGFWAPEYLNAYAENRDEIVYASHVQRSLHHGLFGRIHAYELLKQKGKKFNPKVLLHGENGTGKTAAGLICAQYCLENGFGFIQCKADEDLEMVVNFASHIGHPMMVMVEDGEGLVNDNPEKMRKLMDLFDGMHNKGREVGLLVTTNHPEKLPASLVRARRFNRIIYVSDLDADALRRLIDIRIPENQREDLDYDALEEAFEGFKPSSIVQVLENAEDASIIMTGKLDEPITTEDIVLEAEAMRPHLDLLQRALEQEPPQKLESALRTMVRGEVDDALTSHVVDLSDGEILIRG